MSLNWMWNDKMGEAVMQLLSTDMPRYETLNLYQGNALMIALHETRDQEGRNLYSMQWFAADEQHLKNLLGLNRKQGFDNNTFGTWGIKKLKLNTRYKSVPKIVSLIAKAKMPITIELYYEEG